MIDWEGVGCRLPKFMSGRSAAWLARCTGGAKVGSSNLPGPTIFIFGFLYFFVWE